VPLAAAAPWLPLAALSPAWLLPEPLWRPPGAGNQTPQVSAAVIARVFLDPDLRLFDYCPKRLLNSVPEVGGPHGLPPPRRRGWCAVRCREQSKPRGRRANGPLALGAPPGPSVQAQQLLADGPCRARTRLPLQMFAFPPLEQVFATIADKSAFNLHCNRSGPARAGVLCWAGQAPGHQLAASLPPGQTACLCMPLCTQPAPPPPPPQPALTPAPAAPRPQQAAAAAGAGRGRRGGD
jgi:hypothetical protein